MEDKDTRLNLEDLTEDKEEISLVSEYNSEETSSLLEDDNTSSTGDNDNSSTESLGFIGEQNNSASSTTEVDLEKLAEAQERQRIINEHNKAIMKSPEYRAQVVYENYVQTCGRILSGAEKRSLRREFLRNAKKGKYDYLFDEEKMRKRKERMKAKFDKMNKPAVHTVDEIPENVQKDLLDMVDLPTNKIVDDRNS